MQGHGIHIIDAFYPKYLGGDYIMEEMIQQHPEMCFNNKSVNIIRVYTVLDAKGEPHIIKALLRAGCGESIVDNVHASGGRLYSVDDNTGVITGGASM